MSQKSARKANRRKSQSQSEYQSGTNRDKKPSPSGLARIDNESTKMINISGSLSISTKSATEGKPRSASFAEIVTLNIKPKMASTGTKHTGYKSRKSSGSEAKEAKKLFTEQPKPQRILSETRNNVISKYSTSAIMVDSKKIEFIFDDKDVQEISDLMIDVANKQLKEDSEKNQQNQKNTNAEIKSENVDTEQRPRSSSHNSGFQTPKVWWNRAVQQCHHKYHQCEMYNNTNQGSNANNQTPDSQNPRFGYKSYRSNYQQNNQNGFYKRVVQYQTSSMQIPNSSAPRNRLNRAQIQPNQYNQCLNYSQQWYNLPEMQQLVYGYQWNQNIFNNTANQARNMPLNPYDVYNNQAIPYYWVPGNAGQPPILFFTLNTPTVFCVPYVNTANSYVAQSPSPPALTYATIVGQGLNRNEQIQPTMAVNSATLLESPQQHCNYFNGVLN